MKRIDTACTEVDNLLDGTDDFEDLPHHVQQQLRDHWNDCETCRFVHEMCLPEYGNDAPLQTDGPLPPLDDLARHRIIDQILKRADAPLPRSRRFRWIAVAAVAAATTVALIGIALSPRMWRMWNTPMAADSAGEAGTIVMLSGQTCEQTALNTAFETDDTLRTSAGTAAVQLPTEVLLVLAPETTVTAMALNHHALDISLDDGVLYINASSHRTGPPIRISTSHGVVTVTGTALAVYADSVQTRVDVFKGTVNVAHQKKTKPLEVRAGQSTVVSFDGVPTVQQRDFSSRIDAVLQLQYLHKNARGNAALQVDSSPSGAQVYLDETYLGDTPLKMTVGPGYRRLRLTRDNYASVKEVIDVPTDRTVPRHFLLEPVDTSPQPVSPRTVSKSAATTQRDQDAPVESEGATAEPQIAMMLLKNARRAMKEKDWQTAATLYQQVTRRYPGSRHAANAHVAAGQIILSHLENPARALTHFDTYLDENKNGSLTPEVLLGKANALRSLGRPDVEQQVLEQLLTQYPDSIHCKVARRRLDELFGKKDLSQDKN